MFVHSLASFVKRSLVDLIIWLNIWGLIINIEDGYVLNSGFRRCEWWVFFNEKESFLLVFYWFLRWFISPFILLKWIIFFLSMIWCLFMDPISFTGLKWLWPLYILYLFIIIIFVIVLCSFFVLLYEYILIWVLNTSVVHSGYIGNEMKLKLGKVRALIPNIHTIKQSE